MKELFIKILSFLMFVLVVALGCIGYNIYEDTLAAVWIPLMLFSYNSLLSAQSPYSKKLSTANEFSKVQKSCQRITVC